MHLADDALSFHRYARSTLCHPDPKFCQTCIGDKTVYSKCPRYLPRTIRNKSRSDIVMAGKKPSSASAKAQTTEVKTGAGKTSTSARTQNATGASAAKPAGGAAKAPTGAGAGATPKAPGGKVPKK
ncbi:hypothetical protein LshimejAT787_0702000 [Lyophyllum shimeji]|uniref:Uncharacterized protein n=1 Tax=Lyophyllum shimeji TaxID=47721 RepID=A0A9P3PNI7_LYOSH|nr:hypothetical protein LshimejAT787_0702000 [Lyophyllum shimeji]